MDKHKKLFARLCILSRKMHSMSMIYRPVNVIPVSTKKTKNQSNHVDEPQKVLSKSLKLMLDNGIIRSSSCNGSYHLLPIGVRSLEKLIKIVDTFMEQAGCQKMQMPILTSTNLWETTGRLVETGSELMKVTDRHSKSFLLSPTHEEAICDLISSHPVSYRQMPLRLYQITDKFRDEKRPRFGLMRSRQFLMKDLYTFDRNEESARKTYEKIIEIYGNLFDYLGVKWAKAIGSTGTIGGTLSHEFHLYSDVGEDSLVHCNSCNTIFNQELFETMNKGKIAVVSGAAISNTTNSSSLGCIECGSSDLTSDVTSIEVAHAFLLGTKYTEALKTTFVNEESQSKFIEMGCYGVGVSRLLAAVLEVLSSASEMRWPLAIAPYLISILPPKAGSKEEPIGKKLSNKMEHILQEMLGNDVLLDDRLDQTVGKRIIDAKKLGIPFIAVFGKSVNSPQPLIELHDVNSGEIHMMLEKEVINFLYDAKSRTLIKG